ncbi:MAG: aminopeptidase P family protein [Candidatus Symbiothrix sp.]|jgi:Xaa-Pro aminopeptidase|nr:aminopeptidase P family protein [Candidatus Symbiothrix sp.]
MANVHPNIQAVRKSMLAANVQACIIPSTDSHISEYTPARWKTREWVSGFTGSAGTVVVTHTQAGLWTDSRYFLQAEAQLKGSGIDLFKTGLPGTPEMQEWLTSVLSPGDCIGIESAAFAASEALSLIDFFTKNGLPVDTDFAPYDSIWANRPAIPLHPAFILPEHFSGKPAKEKIREVLSAMAQNGTGLTILASLDMIAWLFNIRGNDVDYNPVCVSYAIVSEKETVLFIRTEKLTQEIKEYFDTNGIVLAEYEKITHYIRQIPAGTKILLSPSKINYRLYSAIPETCSITEVSVHPVEALKSIKNEIEIAGIRKAMQKDGVALVKFLIWLEKSLAGKEKITETDVSAKLRELRSQQEFYVGESFETIAGYGPHGAIVHYAATAESDAEILPEGMLLVDSGAQYFDGTTDITRTISTGAVTEEMKHDYTLVLKGHIALASAVFPSGAVGMQLDVLARQFLWKNGLNFLHGTGHGVGHFLNVHEGPQSIRMNHNPNPLQPGMLTSNEPGLYRAGQYGIRIENLILTVPAQTTEYGDFYAFETLTLCPMDTKLIDKDLLSAEEKEWLNNYHRKVYEQLSPFLSEDEQKWLTEK